MTKVMLTENVSPKINNDLYKHVTIICIVKKSWNFFKINDNMHNLYFKLATILNLVY